MVVDEPVKQPFSLTLRPGTDADIPALIALGDAANATYIGKTPEFVGREADVEQAFASFVPKAIEQLIVAESDGVLLGFSATEGETDEISGVWVAPEQQGKGIGAILLAASEAHIRARGSSYSWLTAHIGNRRAIGFYRTHGYALLSVQMAPWGALPDVIYPTAVLGKQLSRPDATKASTMAEVRNGIDTLDPMIVSLLEERFAFIDRAADLKPALAMPARVAERVEEVVINARTQAEKLGLDPVLTENLWRTMVDLAIEREERSFALNRQKDAS